MLVAKLSKHILRPSLANAGTTKAGHIRKAHMCIRGEISVVKSQSKTLPWCRRRTRRKWSHGVARLGRSAFTSGLAINFKTRHCNQSRSEFLASHELRWNGTAPLPLQMHLPPACTLSDNNVKHLHSCFLPRYLFPLTLLSSYFSQTVNHQSLRQR